MTRLLATLSAFFRAPSPDTYTARDIGATAAICLVFSVSFAYTADRFDLGVASAFGVQLVEMTGVLIWRRWAGSEAAP